MHGHFPAAYIPIEQQPGMIVFRMLLFGEARGEQDDEGRLESIAMLAVASTVLNRSKKSGKTIKEVALQPWAYSTFNINDPNREKLVTAHLIDPVSWERADTVCDLVEQGLCKDPTNGSTHYCTSNLWGREDKTPGKPKWFEKSEIDAGRTKELARFGHHVFGVAP